MELERTETVSGLGVVRLRPVRPDDAAALARFFADLAPDDVHARFLAGRHGAPPGYVDALSHADGERDLVLLAVAAPSGDILGGVRLVDGELAITIRSDLKHHGLGRLLMRHLLGYARDHGTVDVFADIAAENRASLGLARKLGFAFSRSARAPSMVRARLHL